MEKIDSSSRNPAVKRILSEWKELKRNRSHALFAQPLEDNLFEWHFTIRGTSGTDFEGGLYHGRIMLPHNYPLKPPNIVFLTPNGRFETNCKICLTVSAHHPETWQPSWSIRTVLTAIIGFMPSPGGGAIGSLDYAKEARAELASQSRAWKCDVCKRCNEELLPLSYEDDPTAMSMSTSGITSSGDLSTSTAALRDDQAAFPISEIAIEKIERLDADSPAKKGKSDSLPPANGSNNNNNDNNNTNGNGSKSVGKGAKENVDEDAQNVNNNNNNNANGGRQAAGGARRAQVQQKPVASFSFLDTSIAVVFFAILYVCLLKWVVVK